MKNNWVYYVGGRKIALLKQDNSTLEYKSPDEAIATGLKFEFTKMPTAINSGDDTIDVDENLALAVVDYVTGKFAENQQNYEKSQYHMREFKRRVYRYQNKRFGGIRQIIPRKPHAIK
tara:strand:- start:50 stop:403 length:354 start_codon:yes stop_codon:yes gene_type:complete